MDQSSKGVPFNRFRVSHAERGESFQNADEPQTGQPTKQGPNQSAMEYLGKAVADLFDCHSCYVAVMSHASGAQLEEVRIGHATIDPSCTTAVARIARKGAGADCALLEPVNARTSFVRKLIGSEPGANSHSVIGRFASPDGSTVVFVAGWRRAVLARFEIPCLTLAVRKVLETVH